METPQQTDVGWQPCPSGTLVNFAGRQQLRKRRQLLAKTGASAALVVLLAAAGYLATRPSPRAEPNFGGIACTEVRDHLPQYAAATLDPQLIEQIRTHLEQCPDCRQAWQKMTPPAQQVSALSHLRQGERCTCPACQRRLARQTRGGERLALAMGR